MEFQYNSIVLIIFIIILLIPHCQSFLLDDSLTKFLAQIHTNVRKADLFPESMKNLIEPIRSIVFFASCICITLFFKPEKKIHIIIEQLTFNKYNTDKLIEKLPILKKVFYDDATTLPSHLFNICTILFIALLGIFQALIVFIKKHNRFLLASIVIIIIPSIPHFRRNVHLYEAHTIVRQGTLGDKTFFSLYQTIDFVRDLVHIWWCRGQAASGDRIY